MPSVMFPVLAGYTDLHDQYTQSRYGLFFHWDCVIEMIMKDLVKSVHGLPQLYHGMARTMCISYGWY